MAITYRKDLDRVLTSDEVDNNFLELETANNDNVSSISSLQTSLASISVPSSAMKKKSFDLDFPNDLLSYKQQIMRVSIPSVPYGSHVKYMLQAQCRWFFLDYIPHFEDFYFSIDIKNDDLGQPDYYPHSGASFYFVVEYSADYSYFDIFVVRDFGTDNSILTKSAFDFEYYDNGLTFLEDFDTSLVEVV